jgi:preprotein translocase subunit SecG
MLTVLTIVHYIVAVLLVLVVLLQFGKGAETGAFSSASSGSQNIFSSSSKGNFLTQTTTVLAVIFFLTTTFLTVSKSKQNHQSLLESEAAPNIKLSGQQPAVPAANASPVTTAPTGTSVPANN